MKIVKHDWKEKLSFGPKSTLPFLILLLNYIIVIPAQSFTLLPGHQKKQPLNVLFIGNSLTYVHDLPAIIQQLALSNRTNQPLKYKMVVQGGATLQDLWNEGQALDDIRQGHWNFVVLQAQSELPAVNPTLMFAYARLFNKAIKQSGAQTIFYMTWAHEDDLKDQPTVIQAYIDIANELHASVAPVGTAWQLWRNAYSSMELYEPDELHPDVYGSYLTACVLYAAIYKKSCLGLTNKVVIDSNLPNSFTAEFPRIQVSAMQKIADQAISSNPATSNLTKVGNIAAKE